MYIYIYIYTHTHKVSFVILNLIKICIYYFFIVNIEHIIINIEHVICDIINENYLAIDRKTTDI